MTELPSCSLCGKSDENPRLECTACGLFFHPICAATSDTDSPWRCLICRRSSHLTPLDYRKRVHCALLECPTQAIGTVISYLYRFAMNESNRANLLESRLSDVEKKLKEISECPRDVSMDTPSTSSTLPKRTYVVGNDLKYIQHHLKSYLPKSGDVVYLGYSQKKLSEMLQELYKKLNEEKEMFQQGVFLHPGLQDCLLLEGEHLVESLKIFSKTLKDESPSALLTVFSVPQYVEKECSKVNAELSKLQAEGLLKFVPVMNVQADLLLTRSPTYSSETADRIAYNFARHIASFLGVSPPKKKKPSPRVPPRGKQAQPQLPFPPLPQMGTQPLQAFATIQQNGTRPRKQNPGANRHKSSPQVRTGQQTLPQPTLYDFLQSTLRMLQEQQFQPPKPKSKPPGRRHQSN